MPLMSSQERLFVCPECQAKVPLVGGRLLVHQKGTGEYAYPRGDACRCPGSLLPFHAPERTDGSGTPQHR
jgi:hypothetical protein